MGLEELKSEIERLIKIPKPADHATIKLTAYTTSVMEFNEYFKVEERAKDYFGTRNYKVWQQIKKLLLTFDKQKETIQQRMERGHTPSFLMEK